MRRSILSTTLAALFAAASLEAPDAHAVRLDPEAGGQALIYPYYTVRSYGTDPFNTYLSIVDTSADGKALRVRFREGKAGLPTLEFNLFLSPNDTWTGALVPSADGGTQLVTADSSCVSPPMPEIRSSGGTVTAPFSPASSTLQAGCEVIAAPVFDRSAQEFLNGPCSYNFDECPQPQTPAALCAAATVLPWSLSERPNVPLFGSKVPIQPSYVLSFSNAVAPSTRLPYAMYIGGAIRVAFRSDGPQAGLVSLGTSSRMDLRTGAVETGAFRIQGLPATGFMARSFVNGTLSCQGKACQGNYASAFMHQGMRSIGVVP